MKKAILFASVVAAVGLIWAGLPVMDAFGRWILRRQGEVQVALAGQLRGVAGAAPGAIWALLALSFVYGFAHAAGPGHGKVVLGAYAGARRIAALKVAGLAGVTAFAQGTMAVALVGILAGLAGWGRRQLAGVETGLTATLGAALVLGMGLWLIWRAVTGWRARRCPPATRSPEGPAQALLAGRAGVTVYGPTECPDCGRAHLPDPGALVQARPREIVALIGAVALRPCSGAVLVLALTWQMGILWAGVLAAYAMALGTAVMTGGLAVLVVLGRDAVWRGAGRWRGLAQGLEALAGTALVLAAASVLLAGAS